MIFSFRRKGFIPASVLIMHSPVFIDLLIAPSVASHLSAPIESIHSTPSRPEK